MEYVRKGFRRVKNRIVNRPSAVQKRYYLKLRAQLDPLRKPSDSGPNRPVLMISGITMRGTGIFCHLLAFLRWVDFAPRMGYIPVIDMQNGENLYLEDELLGKVNAYEYFYRQPAGVGVEALWKAVMGRECCIRPIERFDTTDYEVHNAGEICGFDATEHGLTKKEARRFERVVQYAIVASDEAIVQAGLSMEDEDPSRVSVVFGSGSGGIDEL